MNFLNDFSTFGRLYEENKSYSPLKTYSSIAFGVSRAFNLLSYFYAIAKVDADPGEWKKAMLSISSKKTHKEKWDQIIKTAETIQSQINTYAAKRRSEVKNAGKYFDVGLAAEPIEDALKKFRSASEILVKQLSDAGIKERLSLIDRSIPYDPYKLKESQIFEGRNDKRTPTESEIIQLVDMLSGSVTQALSTARNMEILFPDAKSYLDGVVKKFITPASQKIDEILGQTPPDDKMELSKSVRKSYEDKGWILKTVRDKYLIDQYEDLIDLKDLVRVGMENLQKAKDNVIKELAPQGEAGEFIDVGNRILDSVESKIAQKEKVEDLRRRANLMLPIAKDEPLPARVQTGSQETVSGSGYVKPDELKKLLLKRVGN